MALLNAVRGPLAGEFVPLDRPGETAALGDPGDIDRLHFGERVDFDLAADGHFADRTANFADESLRLAIGLGEQLDAGRGTLLGALAVELGDMTTDTASCQATRLIRETQLNGFVPISFDGADLQHVARAGLNDRHRNDLPRLIEELRHPDLAAEYTNCHRSVPCGQLPDGSKGQCPNLPVRLPIMLFFSL